MNKLKLNAISTVKKRHELPFDITSSPQLETVINFG